MSSNNFSKLLRFSKFNSSGETQVGVAQSPVPVETAVAPSGSWRRHPQPGRDLKWYWYHDAICEHLEYLWDGKIRRLMIWMPPGTTKSTIASGVGFPWHGDGPMILLFVAAGQANRQQRRAITILPLATSSSASGTPNPSDPARIGQSDWGLTDDQNDKGLDVNIA